VREVEIDPATGAVAVSRHTAVQDVGAVINPLLADGQLHGGIAQGIGQALIEQCVYDAGSGQLLTGSFQDCALPRADDLPSFVTLFDEGSPTRTNVLGAKGVGEAGPIGASPALVHAVIDALRPYGVEHVDMPVTREKVWRLLRRTPGWRPPRREPRSSEVSPGWELAQGRPGRVSRSFPAGCSRGPAGIPSRRALASRTQRGPPGPAAMVHRGPLAHRRRAPPAAARRE